MLLLRRCLASHLHCSHISRHSHTFRRLISMSSSSSSSAVTSAVSDAAWRPSVPVGHSAYTWGALGQAEGAKVATSASSSTSSSRHAAGAPKAAGKAPAASVSSSASAPPPAATGGPPLLLGRALSVGSNGILPVADRRNVLITSALPYVNNVPHLGNIIGCVLSADVYARFCRLRAHNTLFICGTDEYGTATERKAIEEKMSCKEVCDKYHAIHAKIYDWFNIKFDKFGRTTTQQQTEIAQDIFLQLEKHGWSSEKDTRELYCDFHQKFLADRFVEGTCPHCSYIDARGDQCDGCGQTLDAIDLIQPQCKLCKEARAINPEHPQVAPKIVTSRHLFLDLEKLQPELTAWIDKAKVKGGWSDNAIQITMGQLAKGLKSRPITKDLKWGTPVPKAGYDQKVFYVWFDAPIGYISITANYTPEWKQWWKNPEKVELVQFMGKDNIPFHTVMFPASLLAADKNYTLLHHVSCTEYLNYEGTKFSKSRNTGVFGDDAISTGIPSEVWRYYLLFNRPEAADTVFLWEDFVSKSNNELLNNLGNFINRTLAFIYTKLGNVVPPFVLTDADQAVIAEVSKLKGEYIDQLEKVQIKDALKTVMAISKRANQFMQDNKPWELFKTDRQRCDTVLFLSVNLISTLAVLLEPYMPSLSDKINLQLNQQVLAIGALDAADPQSASFQLVVKPGHILGVPSPLFRKIEDEELAQLRLKFGGKPAEKKGEPFPLQLLLGTVVEAREHEGAPHLAVLQIQTDESADVAKTDKLIKAGFRQVVAAVRPSYEPQQLVGQRFALATNIKPSNFKGVRSEGVLLTAIKGSTTRFLTVSEADAKQLANGAAVLPDDCVSAAKPNSDVKSILKKLDLVTRGERGVVHFGNQPLTALAPNGAKLLLVGDNTGEGAKIQS